MGTRLVGAMQKRNIPTSLAIFPVGRSKEIPQKCDIYSTGWPYRLGWLFDDLLSWKRLLSLPCVFFGLSTYTIHSLCWLIHRKRLSKKVWGSDNRSRVTSWKSSLPWIPTERHSPTVVNTGSPEYLVVTGGSSSILEVDVLVGKQWMTVVSLPDDAHAVNYTLHNGNLWLCSYP